MPRIESKRVLSLLLVAGMAAPGSVLFAQNSSPPPASSQPAQDGQPPESRARRLQKLLNPDQAERQGNDPVPLPATVPIPVPPGTAPPSPAPAPMSTPPPNSAPKPMPLPTGPKLPPADVKSVQIVHDKDGAAIEILSSRPVPPALQTLPFPPRLVIDLPNANVAVKQKQITAAEDEQFTAIRVDQFQVTPPVTRVVVDLKTANQYTWDAAGNRLMIRLKPAEPPKPVAPPAAQPAMVSTLSSGPKPTVVPVTTNPSGSMVLAGSRIGNGSSVTASNETAVLHIARGGEVHVCPGSTVSITTSRNGQDMMLGMSSGGLETHYHLNADSDAILTPDFRILLAGPGDFNYAVTSNARGDTCVRALLGNTASAIVTELMGDRSYQVKPTEQVVFHEGRIDRLSNDVPADCGCPGTPAPPVMRASASPTTTVSDVNLPTNVHLSASATPAAAFRATLDPMLPPLPSSARSAVTAPSGSQVNLASASPETAPLPPTKPNDIHVQIVAPFSFRGTDPAPAPVTKAQNVPVKPTNQTQTAKLDPPALPPPPVPAPKPPEGVAPTNDKPQRKGFFGHVKGFFSSIFK